MGAFTDPPAGGGGEPKYVQDSEPADPEIGERWQDTSVDPDEVYIYGGSGTGWISTTVGDHSEMTNVQPGQHFTAGDALAFASGALDVQAGNALGFSSGALAVQENSISHDNIDDVTESDHRSTADVKGYARSTVGMTARDVTLRDQTGGILWQGSPFVSNTTKYTHNVSDTNWHDTGIDVSLDLQGLQWIQWRFEAKTDDHSTDPQMRLVDNSSGSVLFSRRFDWNQNDYTAGNWYWSGWSTEDVTAFGSVTASIEVSAVDGWSHTDTFRGKEWKRPQTLADMPTHDT